MAEGWFSAPGTYSHNPWLNTGFNWYLVREIGDNRPIRLFPSQVSWDHPYYGGDIDTLDMLNPYSGSMPTQFKYMRNDDVAPANWDYRWEDGWELLWMNMGYYPDGHSTKNPAPGSYYDVHDDPFEPIPANIPYFVLYNRYRGLLRLVSNVWYPTGSNYSNINAALKFTLNSQAESKVTGLLRNASAYDVALSEPTAITAVHAPRFHAPDFTQWLVADFQMAYDPCSCQSQGELEFEFTAFNILDVDIIGRSVAIDVPINDNNYSTREFLNISDVNVDSYVPGTEIYQNMDRLADQYRERQLQYLEDLDTYNQFAPLRMALEIAGIESVGKFIANGITNITLTDSLYTWINLDSPLLLSPLAQVALLDSDLDLPKPLLELDTVVVRQFSEKAKKQISNVFGNFSSEIFSAVSPGKPKPPTVPVATIEESVYKGTITGIDTTYSSAMALPGSLPNAFPSGTTLEPHRLPVYNEVLGQVALLETPEPIAYWNIPETTVEVTQPYQPFYCERKERWTNETSVNLKFEQDWLFALNAALDFDMEKTNTYAQLVINVRYNTPSHEDLYMVDDYVLENESNLIIDSDSMRVSGLDPGYRSEWIRIEDFNQHVFSWSRKSVFDINKYGEWSADLGSYICTDSDNIQDNPNITPSSLVPELEIKLKVMHDFYFDQIGSSDEQVNVMQVYSYLLYSNQNNINFLNTNGPWATDPTGYFDAYISGLVSIGNEDITLSHPYVSQVIGNEIFINAQKVLITGELEIPGGYSLVIQALEEIKLAPAVTSLNPNIHMRIKKDFYDTPVFEYADDGDVAAFCNNSNAYQANFPTAALQERINQQLAEEAIRKSESPTAGSTSLLIFPNPARSELTLRASGGGLGHITIYDTSGRPVMQANAGGGASEHRMDIGAIAPGIYIVQATCGDEVHAEKLVVAR